MVLLIEIKAKIIDKLVRWNKWGASHTEHILNGLPKHLHGEKVTKEAIRELLKDGWNIPAKKTFEIHYSLNPEADEIMQFFEKHPK